VATTTTEGAVKVIVKQSKLSIATGKTNDVSKISLDTTGVAVAQSSNLSDSDTVSIQEDELSSRSKATGNSKAVQAKWRAQKRSCSIVELDEESVERMTSVENEEDSKPAAMQVYDVGVDYGDDIVLENCSRFKITIVNGERIMLTSQSLIILQVSSMNVLFIILKRWKDYLITRGSFMTVTWNTSWKILGHIGVQYTPTHNQRLIEDCFLLSSISNLL